MPLGASLFNTKHQHTAESVKRRFAEAANFAIWFRYCGIALIMRRGSVDVCRCSNSACRAFFGQRAARALGDAGFADFASVGDQEHVHVVTIVFWDEFFHDWVSLVGCRFFFNEPQSFLYTVNVGIDRERWPFLRKYQYDCCWFGSDARKRCEPFSSFFKWPVCKEL